MTKNIVLAAIFSTIIIFISYYWQYRSITHNPTTYTTQVSQAVENKNQDSPFSFPVAVGENPSHVSDVVYKSDLIRVVLSPYGGVIQSVELLAYKDKGKDLQMVLNKKDAPALGSIFWGRKDQQLSTLFFMRRTLDGQEIYFSREFSMPNSDKRFTLVKRYTFHPNEYLFELEIELKNMVNEYLPLDYAGNAYSLYIGPQIGPSFTALNTKSDFRKFSLFQRNKKKNINVKSNKGYVVSNHPSWLAILGKYFSLILVPDIYDYTALLMREGEGSDEKHQIYLIRPQIKASVSRDTYKIYIGPKRKNILARFNHPEDNSWHTQGLQLDQSVDTRFLFGWLEVVLKFIMQLIYVIIPNYGITIILLTVIVKIALLPLTLKGQKSMARLQKLNPQIKNIREQFKNDSERMNREIAELYRREKINPASGCLPLLIQFPFFLAMFGLLGNDFDLRGAVFIPGWVNDLSLPESVLSFSFSLPFIGWTDLRILPFIFLASQFLTFLFNPSMQTTQSRGHELLFRYGFPIFFFFILYNMPSGLLLYWISSNLLTVGQQYMTNTFTRKGSKNGS